VITEMTNNTDSPAAPVDLRTRRERPMFLADWTGAAFIHFAVDAGSPRGNGMNMDR